MMRPITRESTELLRTMKLTEGKPPIKTKIKGVSFNYRQGHFQNLWSSIVILCPQPKNEYDKNAVEVYGFVSMGNEQIGVRKLGYLSKDIAAVLAILRRNSHAPMEQHYNVGYINSLGRGKSSGHLGVIITLTYSEEVRTFLTLRGGPLADIYLNIMEARDDDQMAEDDIAYDSAGEAPYS